MSANLQTIKYDQRTQGFPFGLFVKLSNIVAPTPAVYDYPNYVVLAIGQGEVGLNTVNGKAIINTGGKNRIVGDLDYIIYVKNPPVITQSEYEYAVQNKIYDVIAGYLHQHSTPGDALYNYYQLYMQNGIIISDEFFDNFNDLFAFLKGYPITTVEQAIRIARAIIFIEYFYPCLGAVIFQNLQLPSLTGVYYEDFLAVLNSLTSVFPLALFLHELLQNISQILGVSLSTLPQLLSELLNYAQEVLQQLQQGVEITQIIGLHHLKRKAIEILLTQPLSLIYSLITGYPIVTPIYSLFYPLLRLITAIEEALLQITPSTQISIIEASVPMVPVTSNLESILQEIISLVSGILGVATSTVTETVSSTVSELIDNNIIPSSSGSQFPLINANISILSNNYLGSFNKQSQSNTIGSGNIQSIGNSSSFLSGNTMGGGNTYTLFSNNIPYIGSFNTQSQSTTTQNNINASAQYTQVSENLNNVSATLENYVHGVHLLDDLLNGNKNLINVETSTSTSTSSSTGSYVYKRKYCIVPGVCF